jgi:hypothetical protein
MPLQPPRRNRSSLTHRGWPLGFVWVRGTLEVARSAGRWGASDVDS